MKTADEMLHSICSNVFEEFFPYHEHDAKPDAKQVDDQLYELQKLSLMLSTVVLDVRQRKGIDPTRHYEALRQRLYEVLR